MPSHTTSLKRALVIYPKFKFFITEAEKLLTNEHFEKDHRINLFALCIALAPTYIDFAKKRQVNYSNGIESARRLRTGFLSLIFATLFCSSQKPLYPTADPQISQLIAIGSMPQSTGLLVFLRRHYQWLPKVFAGDHAQMHTSLNLQGKDAVMPISLLLITF